MSDPKADLLQALRVPGNEVAYSSEWFGRVVPTIADLPAVTNADSATVAIAKYCDNCNKILQIFQGVPLIDFLLRGGQRSDPLIGLLLSNLEQLDVKVGEIKLITPVDGGQYFGSVGYYVVSISEGTPESVTATLDDSAFPMTENGDFWTASYSIPTGAHRLSVVADFGGGVTKSVSAAFDLKSWDEAISVPEPEQRLSVIASVQLQTGSTSGVTAVTFTGGQGGEGGGGGASLVWDGGERWIDDGIETTGLDTLPPGDYIGQFSIMTDAGTVTKSVPFTITGDTP